MQLILKSKKFKFWVTVIVLITFMNLSMPFSSIFVQRAYAAETKPAQVEQQKTAKSKTSEQSVKKDNKKNIVSKDKVKPAEKKRKGLIERLLDKIKNFFHTISSWMGNLLGQEVKKSKAAVADNTKIKMASYAQKLGLTENIAEEEVPGIEDFSKRTLYSKTFKKGDKYVAQIYLKPIHYIDNEGKLLDINNNLVTSKKQGSSFENKANSFKTYFSNTTNSNNLVKIKKDNYNVSWSMEGSNNNILGEVSGNKITYPQIMKNVDLRYIVGNDALKEEIILNSSQTPGEYIFKINPGKLTYVRQEDGQIVLKDVINDKILFKLDKPYMYDQKGEKSENIDVQLINENNNVILKMIPDKNWLISNERQYPIIIDPSYKDWQPDYQSGRDTWVGSNQPNTNHRDSIYLNVGNTGSYGITRSYINFTEFDNVVPHGSRVDGADLILYDTRGLTYKDIDVYEVLSDWNWNLPWLTWNNQPATGALITRVGANGGDGWWHFPVTNLAQKWANGMANNGMLVRLANEGEQYRDFWSCDYGNPNARPIFRVWYTPDTNAPNGTISINNGANYTSSDNVNLNLSAWDDITGSNVSMSFSNDGTNYSAWEPYNTNKGWTLSDGDGTKYVYVLFKDIAGNISRFSDTILLDTTAPTPGNLTSPDNGAETSNRTVTFKWSATNDATSGIDHYRVVASDGSTNVLDTNVSASTLQYTYTFNKDFKPLNWTVYAYDKMGFSVKYATHYITIDHTAPTVPAITTETAFTPGLQNTIAWTTSTDLGVGGVKYEVQRATNSSFTSGLVTVNVSATSYIFTGLQDGVKYYYRVRSKDDLANTSAWSGVVSSTQDNTNPLINNLKSNHDIFSPGINSSTVSADITETNLNKWVISIYKGSTLIRTATGTTNNISWTWDGKGSTGAYVTEGNYTITLKATDKAGNTDTASTSVIVDKTAPTVNLSLPALGEVTNLGVYKVQGTYSDNNLPLKSLTVNGTTAILEPNNVFESDLALTEGNNLIIVRAEDRAGNVATVTRDLLMDQTPPTIYNQNPLSGQTLGISQPTIKADYFDLGSGIDTSKARVYLDGVEVTAQSQITAEGITYFPVNGLDKGTHNVKVEIEDIAGNKQSAAWEFYVDLNTFVSITKPLNNALLNKTITDVAGTTEKGNLLKLFINDQQIATIAGSSGNYTFKDAPLTTGLNTIKVEAADAFNNTSSSSIQVSVNTDAPAAGVEGSPAFFSPNGDGQQDTTVFQLSAEQAGSQIKEWVFTISDSNGSVVRSYNDLGMPPALIQWDGKDQNGQLLPDGQYTYKLLVRDFTGQEVVTPDKTITIDTVAPASPQITTPPTDTFGNQSTLMVKGNAEAGAAVSLYNNGQVTDVVQTDSTGQWSYLMPLNSGVNTITARATDAAGNISAASNAVNITVTTIPPLQKVEAAPLLGSSGKVITLKATTTSITKGVKAITPDGKTITLTTNDFTNWTGFWVVGDTVPEGIAVLNFYAEDWAGNRGSGAASVVIDNTPPQVPVIKAPVGPVDSNKELFTFNGEGEPEATLEIYSTLNGQDTKLGKTTVAANGKWDLDNISLPEGENWIWAKSVDAAGNTSDNSDTVILRVDRTPPVVSGQINPLYIPVGHTLNLNAQTSPGTTQVLAVMPDEAVAYLNNGLMGWQGDITVGTIIKDGTYDVTFYAYDAAGNKGTYKTKVIVDSTPPEKPVIDKPVQDEFTNNPNYMITGTAEAGTTVTLYYWDDKGRNSKTTVATNGNWQIQVPLLEGQNTIQATATDFAGNVSPNSDQISFILDTIQPAAPFIDKPANNYITNQPSQVISGTGEPFATITLYHNGEIVDTPLVSPQGEWTSKALTFTEGTNTLQAKATDRAQNTGELSAITKATLDTIPPDPPVQWAKINRLSQFITVYGTAEANSLVTVYLDNNKIGTAQVDGLGNWQFDNVTFDQGKRHTITSTATDAATNVSKVSNPSNILRYFVISGDDLDGLAGFYYGDANRKADIMKYNDLVNERIYHGWNILIPEPVNEGIYSSYRIELERLMKELEQKLANLGKRNNCGQPGEPVNSSLGNFIYDNTDIKLAGSLGMPIEITRSYNAIDFYHGPFGYGWNYNYNIKLNFYQYDNKDYVEVLNFDGRRDLYVKKADGSYQAPQGIFDTLKENADGTFLWETKDKVKYTFTYTGRLTKFADRNGNANTLDYNDQGLMTTITDATGRKVNLTYDQNRRITAITDPAGRAFNYGYDDAGNLTSITYPDGGQVKYAYDDNHQMTSFTDPNGNYVVRNTYDAEGRVIKQLDVKGNESTFNYDSVNRKTTFTDGRGNSFTDQYDESYRLVARIYQDGTQESYTYDQYGNRNSITDKRGNTTQLTYDAKGNLTAMTNALGQVTNFAYDAQDNLMSTINPKGYEVKMTYNDKGQPLTITDARGNTTTLAYNDKGQVVSITDAKNQTASFTYDQMGNITEVKDTKGQITKIEYNELGWRTAVTTPKGETTKFEYDPKGNNTAVIDPMGQRVENVYDKNGNIISVKDAKGNFTKFYYDANGNMEKMVDANGAETIINYDANGNQTSVLNPLGNKAIYQYDAFNRLTKVTDPLGNQTIVGYDPNGNRTTYEDQRGNVTQYGYDALNRLTEVTDALNQKTHFSYDEGGNMIAYTDQAGNVTKYEYNENNQIVKITDAQNNVTQVFYDALGNQEKVIDAKGNAYSYSYDPTGKLTKITDPLNHETVIDYDANGNRTSFKDANGNTTKFGYDPLNRLTALTDALDNITKLEYDANGNKTAVIDANGNKTQYGYDALDRLTKVIDALGTETDYGYNAIGNLTSVKDGNGNITNYQYDANNRVVAAIDPLGNTQRLNYDPAGNIAKRTDAKGAITQYTYNSLDQLTKVLYPDSTSVNYSYNELGQRTQMTDKTGTTNYRFDSLGRLLEVTQADGKKVGYGYDEIGNRTSLKYPDGKVVQYIYDEMNRLQKVTDWDGKTTSYEYDAAGRRTKTILPNGNNTSYNYDAANRLTDLTNLTTSGTISFNYSYDKVGNRISMTEADGKTTQYQYDPLYQLKKVVPSVGKTKEYTYDPVGNRLTMAETEGTSVSTTKYEYNGANELLQKIDPSGQTTQYQYDANGNRISKVGNQTIDYSYDFENRLTKIDDHNGKTIDYAYNGDGVRLSKTVNNPNSTKEVTKFVNDVANPLEQVLAIYDDKDNLQASYVYGNERISVHDMDTTTGAEKDPLYYLYDGLGSVVQLTDSTGKTADQYAFDEFGNQVAGGKQSPNAANVLHNNFGFAGEQWDAEAGLQYLRARYYDPEIGRFINRDSFIGDMLNPISQNRYAYTWNNPVNLTDPSGNRPAGMSYEAYIANLRQQIAVQERMSYNPSRATCGTKYVKNNGEVGGYIQDYEDAWDYGLLEDPNIMYSKTRDSQRDSGLSDLTDDEISKRARDKSLSGNERRRYQAEEKYRGLRNKQKRKERNNISSSEGAWWEKPVGAGLFIIGGIGTIALLADDVTGIGFADDPYLAATGGTMAKGLEMLFSF